MEQSPSNTTNNPKVKSKPKGKKGQKAKLKITKEERRAKYTALARARRDKHMNKQRDKNLICYKCRKRGHSAENCAEAENNGHDNIDNNKQKGQGTICYKCGSTEHRIQICPKIKKYLKSGQTKVDFSKVGELPFASCYVCQKMGHLASSCPQSRNGVFPMGGSCRECGSVDHFAANCPNKTKGDQSNDDDNDSNSVTIDQFLDETDKPGKKENNISSAKKKRKVVNF
ncbi:hypothetical protein ACHAXS_012585 [Conticribra weissflogii]